MSELPSTTTTVTVQLDRWRQPDLTASAAVLDHGEVVFAKLTVDTVADQRAERHAVTVNLVGPRQALLDLLGRFAGQVAAAQVEPE